MKNSKNSNIIKDKINKEKESEIRIDLKNLVKNNLIKFNNLSKIKLLYFNLQK